MPVLAFHNSLWPSRDKEKCSAWCKLQHDFCYSCKLWKLFTLALPLYVAEQRFVFLPLPTMDPSSLWSLQEVRANYSTLLLAALKENSCPHIQRPIFERTVYRYTTYYQHMNEIKQHFQEVGPGMEKQNIFLSVNLHYHCF